ncbi:MAG: helix-turn-helix domain-containing protein [Acidobacteriota bacterium]
MFISKALARSGGNLCRAADVLGLHRNTMTRKVTEYRIKRKGAA